MNNSTFGSPYPPGSTFDQIYQKYHASGFSAEYFLQYHATHFICSLIAILLNLSFIYVSIKSRSKLHNPFNVFIAFESFTSILFASGYLAGHWLVLSGQNVAHVQICVLIRWPGSFGAAMQCALMVFISLERLCCILFPIFHRNLLLLEWKNFYIRIVLFLGAIFGGLMMYVLFSNTFPSNANHYYLCNFSDYLTDAGKIYLYQLVTYAEILALFIYVIILFLLIKARIQRVKLMDTINMQILRSLLVIMGIIIFGWLINATSGFYLPLFKKSDSDWIKILITSVNILASACNGPVLFALNQEYRKCYESVFPCLLRIRINQIHSTTPIQVIDNS